MKNISVGGESFNVSEEKYEAIQDMIKDCEHVAINKYDDLLGKKIFFRTVTYHLLGEVVKKVGDFLELKDASWIADSGRFMNFLKDGTLNEVEPVGTAFINLTTVTDFFLWKHALPRVQK